LNPADVGNGEKILERKKKFLKEEFYEKCSLVYIFPIDTFQKGATEELLQCNNCTEFLLKGNDQYG
jgi:hypothetical protein